MKNQHDESARMEAVRSYHLLDTAPELRYDNLVKLASYICEAPIAFISIMDADRQWFKSKIGLEIDECPRDETFCQYTMLQEELLEVPDSTLDPRFQDHLFITEDPKIRFYAGKRLKAPNGQIVGTICVLDTVARTLTEVQRFALETIANEVIAELELRKANYNLEAELSQVKDEFLANISHEIRTPMNAIIGFTDLLKSSELDTAQHDYLGSISTAGENLLSIINDILDISKLKSGKLNFEVVPFEPKEAIESTYKLFESEAKKKGLNLHIEISNSLPTLVLGDEKRLIQVVSNLLNNGLKFTKKGNVSLTVTGKTVANKLHLQLKVKDTGIGISANQLERIFDRFTQVNQYATREYGGAGLGLSIVKQLVELQGGNIHVNSTENVGSEFIVDLTYELSETPKNHNISMEKLSDFDRSSYQLLLCEDNELNRRLAKTVIEQFGFNLDIVENGKLGVEAVQKKKYDLIIMDLQMPEMDGYEATRNIRNQLNSTVPIMAMTAHSLVGEREKCLEVGMNDYIPKPFRQQELLEKITRLLKEGASAGSFFNDSEEGEEGICDLSYLKGLSGGNKDFERELMELFITQTPMDLSELNVAMNSKNAMVLADIAHKVKSSAQIVGALDAVDALQRLEGAARSQISDSQLIVLSRVVISRLNETVKNISVILDKNEW